MVERTQEEQRDYEKARMLHFSAQLDQIANEIEKFARDEHKGAMYANHQMGVSLSCIRWSARELQKHAGT